MKPDLICPHCGGDNALPFEDDSPAKEDGTIFIILAAGALLFLGYILLLISTYVFFPGVVFISIIVTTKLINKREREKKKEAAVPHDYMCLDCGGYFNSVL